LVAALCKAGCGSKQPIINENKGIKIVYPLLIILFWRIQAEDEK
jgi:hypothetical protein